MAPKKRAGKKAAAASAPSAAQPASKHRKRADGSAAGSSAPAAGGRTTTAAAASAAAAAAATASSARQRATLDDVLFLVLERQRHAAHEARLEEASNTHDDYNRGGCNDADGEGGRTTGGGWRRRYFFDEDPTNSDQADEGADHDHDIRPHEQRWWPEMPYEAGDFYMTCLSASRVCRSWRSLAHRAVDRATVDVGRSHPGRPLTAALLPYAHEGVGGGALRALWLRDWETSRARLRSIARSLGVVKVGKGCRLFPNDARLASVMRGLRVAKIENSAPFAEALSDVALCSPLPSPPLLQNLVTLELHNFLSLATKPLSSRSRAPPRPPFFSRGNLPALRSLRVTMWKYSESPLDVAGGSTTSSDPYVRAPLLTKLVVMRADDKPPPVDDIYSRRHKIWPLGEPLLVSLRSLVALAPTLRSLRVERTWAAAVGTSAPRVPPQPHPAADTLEHDLPPLYPPTEATELHSELQRCAKGDGTNQVPLPDHCAPMRCLARGLSALTNLEFLRIEGAAADFWPLVRPATEDPHLSWVSVMASPAAPLRPRLKQWLAASHLVLPPLAGSLRHLDLRMDKAAGLVMLPNALGVLSSLTRLSVAAHRLVAVGSGLRELVQLRDLSIETLELYDAADALAAVDGATSVRYVHPPVYARDISPLTALRHLTLSHAAPCLAPLIARELPELVSLRLWSCGLYEYEYGFEFPPCSVLEAALARMRSGDAFSAVALGEVMADPKGERVWPDGSGLYDEEDLERLIERHQEGGWRARMHDEIHRGNEDAGNLFVE